MSASQSPSPQSRGRSVDRETPRDRSSGGRDDNVGTMFVGNLNHETTERRLRDFFEAHGRVLSAKIVINPETQRSKGFGFVKFEDPRDADDAIREADGKMLDGRQLKCNFAKYNGPRAPHNNPGFRGGGRGGDFSGGRGYRGDLRGSFRGGRGAPGGRGYPGGGGGGGQYGYNGQPYSEPRDGSMRAGRGRSRSPGRYSPGRYSPGRFSPRADRGEGGSRSPEPARSRSGSPAPKRRRAAPSTSPPRGAPPLRGGREGAPPGGRRSGSAGSASRSSASYSSTDSGRSCRGPPGAPPALGEIKKRRENGGSLAHKATATAASGARAAAAASAAAATSAAKADLVAARQREDELSSRLAALEAEVGSLRGAKSGLQERVLELTERLQKEQEASKQYKKWLESLATYSRALLGAKAALATAQGEAKEREDDLTVFLEHADAHLLAPRAERARRKSHRASGTAADAGKGVAAIEGAPAAENGAAAMATDNTPAAAEAPPAAAGGGEGAPAHDGTWAEEDGSTGDVAAKFKPGIKFKLTG